MNTAEISLAFAREVACLKPGAESLIGDIHGDMVCICGWHEEDWDHPYQKLIPDYASDWNATIAVLEHRGMSWGTEYVGGQKYFWVESGSLFKIEEGKGPSALMLAAVKCVREQGNG